MILCLLFLSQIVTTTPYRYLDQESWKSSNLYNVHKYLADTKQVPHHVLIFYNNYYCSGSIIGSKTVLTCATCFHKRDEEDKVFVKIGSGYIMEPGTIIAVIEVKIHEFYRHLSELDNDIAMLYLEAHVPFSSLVKKIVVVEPEMTLKVNTVMEVTGYAGRNLTAKFMGRLMSSTFMVVSKEECESTFGGTITLSNYCAKYSLDQRMSDNGGGAVVRDFLVGVLSYGGTSLEPPYLGIFTNTSYFHRWILLNTRRLMKKYCQSESDEDEDSDMFSPEDDRSDN